MTHTPTPRQTATDAAEGASQPREGAGRPPARSETLSGAVEGSGDAVPAHRRLIAQLNADRAIQLGIVRHAVDEEIREAASTLAYGCLHAIARTLTIFEGAAAAEAYLEQHADRGALGRTTLDNPATSSNTVDNSEVVAAVERLRAENAAAQSLIRMQDEAIQRVRDLANQLALDSPWGRETAHRFRLAVQPPAPDGPTVAEAAADDKRHWSEREWEGE
ncbi:hypothetical protein ACWGH2_29320 [Streptomyces sp. NPDC054871]